MAFEPLGTTTKQDSFQPLNPADIPQEQPKPDELPGNIITDIPKGLVHGVESQILSPATSEAINIASVFTPPANRPAFEEAAQNTRDWWKKQEAKVESPVANVPWSQYPIRKTVYNIAESAPIVGAAMATGDPLLAAAVFAPSLHGQALDVGMESGMPRGQANIYGLEKAIPNTALMSLGVGSWLVGGSMALRSLRTAVTLGVVQGVPGTAVNNIIDKYVNSVSQKTGNIYRDITDGMLENVVTGGGMGALMGMVTPPSALDIKTDTVKRIDKGIDTLQKSGHPEAQQTIDDLNHLKDVVLKTTTVEDLMKLKDTPLTEDPNAVAGLGTVELTSPEGNDNVPLKRYKQDTRIKSRVTAERLMKEADIKDPKGNPVKFLDLSDPQRTILENIISEQMTIGKTPEEIKTLVIPVISDKLLGMKAVYLSGSEKGAINPDGSPTVTLDTKVYSGALKGYTSIQNLASYLKSTGITPDEVSLYNIKTQNQPAGFVDNTRQVLKQAYDASPIAPATASPEAVPVEKPSTIETPPAPIVELTPEGIPPTKTNEGIPIEQPIQTPQAVQEPIVEPRPISEQMLPIEPALPEVRTEPKIKPQVDEIKESMGIPTQDTEEIPAELTDVDVNTLKQVLEKVRDKENYLNTKKIVQAKYEEQKVELTKKAKKSKGGTEVMQPWRQGLPADATNVIHWTGGETLGMVPKEGQSYVVFDKMPATSVLKAIRDWNSQPYWNKKANQYKPGLWIKNKDVTFVFPEKLSASEIKTIDTNFTKTARSKFERQEANLAKDEVASLREAENFLKPENVTQITDLIDKEMAPLIDQLPSGLQDKARHMSAEQLSEFIKNVDAGIAPVGMDENIVAPSDYLEPSQMGVTTWKPLEVKDVDGNTKILQASADKPLKLRIDDAKSDRVHLVDGEDVWIPKSEFKRLLMNRDELDIEFGMNDAFGGMSPEARQRYNDLKALGNHGEIQTNEVKDVIPNAKDIKPRTYPMKEALEGIRFHPFGGALNDFLGDLFNDIKVQKEKTKAQTFQDVKDEVITHIFGDKVFHQFAEAMSWDQMRPVMETIFYKIVPKDVQAKNPELKGMQLKKALQAKTEAILKLMSPAAAEISSNSGNLNKYSYTDVALPGPHEVSWDPLNPQGEAIGYVERVKEIMKLFDIPVLDMSRNFDPAMKKVFDDSTARGATLEQALEDALMSGRMKNTFWNLLVHPNVASDNSLQTLLVHVKGEIETPILNSMLEHGILSNADMFHNIQRGYFRRLAVKKEQQEEKSGFKRAIDSTDQPQANYRTYSEFVWQGNRRGLQPIDDYMQSMRDYIRDGLISVQQSQSIKVLKTFKASPISAKLFEGLNLQDSTKVAIEKIVQEMNLVEYKTSDTVTGLSKILNLDADDILQKLGYAQAKDAPGLVEWSKGMFKKPYLYAPLKDMINTMYNPGKTSATDTIRQINQWTNTVKRWITIVPTDSNFLWMSAVLVNTNPIELTTRILPTYLSVLARNLPIIGEAGRKIMKGEYYEGTRLDSEHLKLAIKTGFSAASYQEMMRAAWDEHGLGKDPEMATSLDNFKELAYSVGGTNSAIFQHFISHEVMKVWSKRFEYFKSLGWSDMDAARRTTKFINETSLMQNAETYGKWGPWHTLALFTRGITNGFVRQLTAFAWPVAKKIPGVRNLYNYHTGTTSDILNAWFHGETSKADMDALSKYYAVHLAKMMVLKVGIQSLIQYVMSFSDDDQLDEHGQIANGDINAKKRYMWLNEPGKRWAVRLPWKNFNEQRIYMDFQLLREATQIGEIFGGMINKDWGQGPGKWAMNRLNLFPRWMGEMMMNVDYAGKPISTYPAENTADWMANNMPQYFNFFAKELAPLGFKEEPLSGKAGVDSTINLVNWFGGTPRFGAGNEGFFTSEELAKDKQAAAMFKYRQEQGAPDFRNMTPEEVMNLKETLFLSPQTIKKQFMKKILPGMEFWKANRSKVIKEMLSE